MLHDTSHDTFRSLFRSYYPQLRAFASTLVGEHEADDVVEDVFADLWKRRDSIELGDRTSGYLYRCVYTRAMSLLRHRHVAAERLQLLDDINEYREQAFETAFSPHHQLERKELRHRIETAIDQLPEKCRQVFRMSYQLGMSHQAIADELNITPRTVDTHVYNALKQLRKML